jgi:DNA-binding XRE family transcriptional regulator
MSSIDRFVDVGYTKANLVLLMESCGITQRELALAIGFTPTAVGYWVSGRSRPRRSDTWDLIISACRSFRV